MTQTFSATEHGNSGGRLHSLLSGHLGTVLLTWPAVVVAGLIGWWLYGIGNAIPTTYRTLISGSLSFSGGTKYGDYLSLIGFIVAGVLAWFAFEATRRRVADHHGAEVGGRFVSVMLWSATPAAIWVLGLPLAQSPRSWLLVAAGGTMAASLLATGVVGWRSEKWLEKSSHFDAVVGRAVAAGVSGALAGSGLALAANYVLVDIAARRLSQTTVFIAVAFGLLVGIGTAWLRIAKAPSSAIAIQSLHRLLVVLQWPVMLLILAVLPVVWVNGNQAFMGYELSKTSFGALFLAFWAVGSWDLWRKRKATGDLGALSWLSPFALVSTIVLLKAAAVIGPPLIPLDDYHFGEFLNPWWTLVSDGQLPYVGHTPARGILSNYAPMALSVSFFDGTAAAVPATFPLLGVLMILVAYRPLVAAMGLPVTVLALTMYPLANGLWEIHIAWAAVFALLMVTFGRSPPPARWLLLWLAVGTAMVLLAPGQGAILVIATIPMGLTMVLRGVKEESVPRTLAAVSGFALGGLLVLLLTPLGEMVFGAARYGLEQARSNLNAFGITWSFGLQQLDNRGQRWWELVRASWVFLPLFSGVIGLVLVMRPKGRRLDARLVGAIALFVTGVLYIARAAGRIDPPPSWSRMGITTAFFGLLLLPLLLSYVARATTRHVVIVLLATVGVMTPFVAGIDPTLIYDRPALGVPAPDNLVDGSALGLPNMGRARVDPEHLMRLLAVNDALDRYGSDDRSYLDLTNRAARYFYTGAHIPIEVGAVYNLADAEQEYRNVERLRREAPRLILASSGDNDLLDGGVVSLRSHFIYRFAMDRYRPILVEYELGTQVWMLENARSPERGDESRWTEEELRIVDSVFRPRDLRLTPWSWGASEGTLIDSELRMATGVEVAEGLRMSIDTEGRFEILGIDPGLVLDIPAGTDGWGAGLLRFDLACDDPNAAPVLAIYWNADDAGFSEERVARFRSQPGVHLVPLDAYPRWLTATHIDRIRFDIEEPGGCETGTISGLAIYQRTAVDRLFSD